MMVMAMRMSMEMVTVVRIMVASMMTTMMMF